jgi:hypothetical protein
MRHARALGSVFLAAVWLGGCSGAEQKPPAPQPALTPPAAHGSSSAASAPAAPAIPPFHESAEAAKPFPVLRPPERYRDYPAIERAYRVAHRIPEVVAQQPCYCWCNKVGHTSLLDCFASDHGAG